MERHGEEGGEGASKVLGDCVVIADGGSASGGRQHGEKGGGTRWGPARCTTIML